LLLHIEKLIYGGDGLARLPAPTLETGDDRGRGKAVFVPFVLPGEEVEAALTEEKPGFARAEVQAIMQPSPQRIAPACPYFARCGGCHYQHAGYEYQLEIKHQILRENLRRIAKVELDSEIVLHPSPSWNYRNRSRLQVRTTPEFAAGYFKFSSHDLQPVEECPISSPLINRGIAALWCFGRVGKVPEGVDEVEFFSSGDDSQMLVDLSCRPDLRLTDARRAAARTFAKDLCAAMPEIAGVSVFRDSHTRRESLLAEGDPQLNYRTRNSAYRVSAGSFFQTNRFLVDELVEIVTKGRSGDLALDLYAGVGLFSTALACAFRHVISVESSQTSTNDLKHNLPINGKAVYAAVEQYLAQGQNRGRVGADATLPRLLGSPDLVVVDPPRGGMGERVARAVVLTGARRLTYVSCDPATLARDLAFLLQAGYRIEEVHLVDLFPQTYHLESVVHLAR
jgi:23S rRNA (uracil1939-C5)-methyltransferase